MDGGRGGGEERKKGQTDRQRDRRMDGRRKDGRTDGWMGNVETDR